jgi:hypothetical protein
MAMYMPKGNAYTKGSDMAVCAYGRTGDRI